ncbi:MAG TPA: hypothetical protein VL284_03760 [Thermoanaerobaculia bacterium]|nr:hypothetical protein [Thermoanaerobaculia bacterium]
MRRSHLAAILVCGLLPVAAFAIGPVSSTGNTAATTSQVSITVPAVIAIDVESNATFDFTNAHYHLPASPTDCTDAFPPGANCATATFTPSNVTEPAGGTAGQIWLAVFSNQSGHEGTMDVTAAGDAAFSADPGFTPQAIRLTRGTTNVAVNGKIFGKSSATAIGTTGTPLDLFASGTMTSSVFGWTRIDQTPDISVPGTTSFNAVTGATANITFTLTY